MASTLSEIVAHASAKRRAKIAAALGAKVLADEQKRIAVEKWLRLEQTKRAMELDRNLIVIAVIITALPIVAALVSILAALAVDF